MIPRIDTTTIIGVIGDVLATLALFMAFVNMRRENYFALALNVICAVVLMRAAMTFYLSSLHSVPPFWTQKSKPEAKP